ncbi:LPXTG cell wall anchor domain-containing protein [Lactiplantibacillus pentosus]|uniref:LPXTG cell wall anchor domain-containing protein n=1 Tax=Lactiplantibacillus pentosus TaxID=1589 RepID=UPI00132F61A7|nr:LPXTG cell wall anchor domain-containing protein [Lactiplantibacillus pentosus]MBQ0837056.1 LPXTG cell wall anchor domain-containing protein [Lactiplantibacillus pentosus]
MRKRWQWLLLALTGLFLLMFSPPLVSQAREVIEATGNDVNSAVIKDSAGNVISHDAQLPADADYTVNYKWRIPDNVKITAGDTMTFQVPANVTIPADDSFPMTGTIAGSSGNFFIAAGSHTGVVTFNKIYQYATVNRSGYVTLDVKGTVPEHPGNLSPILLDKTAAWEDPADPYHIIWTVHVLPNENELVDPSFVDTLGPDQTFVAGSAVLHDANGNAIPVTAAANGNQITFNASGNYVTALTLTYKTQIDPKSETAVFTNDIEYTDKNGNRGSADSSIDKPKVDVPENPGVTEPNNPDENESPEEPGVTEPEKPGTSTPEEPGVTEPEKPGTSTPEEPGVTEPEKPGTSTPEEPGVTEPEKPGTSTPEEPGVTEPEKPGTSTPEEPGVTEPEKPGTSTPEEPGVTEPEKPGTSTPEKPGVTEPEKPGTSTPEKPGVTEPEKPGTSTPEKPGVTEPEKPGTSTPEEPGVTEPEKPGTSTPEEPGVTEPEKPSVTTPEQPNGETPSKPSVTAPNTSKPSQPSTGTANTPAVSGQPTVDNGGSGNNSATGPSALASAPFYRSPLASSTNVPLTTTQSAGTLPATAAVAFAGSTTARHLPQTNERSSSWLILLGLVILLVVLSYVLLRRQPHHRS